MWKLLLHRFLGIGEAPDGVRFGIGVVGHTTRVMIGLLVAVSAIAWALSEHAYVALATIVALCLMVCFFLVGTWTFAGKHPDQAAMGDSTWWKFRQFQMERKNSGPLPSLPHRSDPVKLANPVDVDQSGQDNDSEEED